MGSHDIDSTRRDVVKGAMLYTVPARLADTVEASTRTRYQDVSEIYDVEGRPLAAGRDRAFFELAVETTGAHNNPRYQSWSPFIIETETPVRIARMVPLPLLKDDELRLARNLSITAAEAAVGTASHTTSAGATTLELTKEIAEYNRRQATSDVQYVELPAETLLDTTQPTNFRARYLVEVESETGAFDEQEHDWVDFLTFYYTTVEQLNDGAQEFDNPVFPLTDGLSPDEDEKNVFAKHVPDDQSAAETDDSAADDVDESESESEQVGELEIKSVKICDTMDCIGDRVPHDTDTLMITDDRFAVDVMLNNPLGESTLRIEVYNPSGELVETETTTGDAWGNTRLFLIGDQPSGEWRVDIVIDDEVERSIEFILERS